MTIQNFGSVVSGDLSITNIAVTETDVGTGIVGDFLPYVGGLSPFFFPTFDNGLYWDAFHMEVQGGSANPTQESVTFNYDVSGTGSQVITGFEQYVQADSLSGDASITATETVEDMSGNVVGTLTWSPTASNYVSPVVNLPTGYQEVQVSVTVTEYVPGGSTASDQASISIISQGFTEGPAPAVAAFTTHVYYDANDDGTQDNGDNNLPGITVTLENGSGQSVESATTDANGNVSFGGLVPGSYEVAVTTPGGDTVTQSTNVTTVNTLVAGQTANAIEGVYMPPQQLPPAAFITHVYYDSNADSSQENGESNLAGVTVTLENGSGTSIGTATTDANGNVSFGGLVPGSYEVAVTTPSGDTVTQHTNVTTVEALAAGQTGSAIEGVYAPAAFVTHVYYDSNADSSQDNGETNLGGVTVTLENGSGTSIGTATTDANGNVSFGGLVPGSYEVAVTTPSGDTVTQHTNVTTVEALAAGQTGSAIEGVYAPAAFVTHVYYDSNADSSQDNGETNLGGVTVTLENGSGTSIGSATTDANGNVSFGGLVPGSYEVAVTKPPGDTVTQHTNVTTVEALAAGQTGSAIEGVYAPAAFVTHVYYDSNADSSQDNGETNLGGVTVTLENGSGTSIGSATTDANGNVSFGGLVPGSYEVAVTKPPGDTVTQHTNVTTVEALAAGQTGSAIEGVYAPAAFVTHVYYDSNADSSQDNGETNLGGVTVTLENGSGTSIGTATTDANGNVSFGGLVPGSYEVAVTTPPGDTVTQHTNVTTVEALAAGQTGSAIEGVYAPAAFITHVYYDTNADSSQDNGESNLAGVTVTLENGSGTSIGTATTDANGNVSFGGLVPGSYEVAVTTPSGDTVTQHTNVATVQTLAAGQTGSAIEGVVLQGGGITGGGTPPGITVIKLPCQVIVGTCGQVTYTYDVTNTGTTPLTNVQVTDNIGTATNPDDITPVPVTKNGDNVGDTNGNGVLDPGETWVYQNTINESGNYSSGSSSTHCSVSGQNLGGGCTAWFNSSFTPTSCKDGASYTFQNISCTISGPNCGSFTVQVPNACVQFSNSCSQPSTTFDSSQNCWITTLPANCNPGDVFLSGLPYQVPSGCNLSGASVTWNIGQSANNCGSSSVQWQVGCQGYSSFGQNGCDGNDDYNQIGVKSCDNQDGYGNGGNTNWGYGWDNGGGGAYCSYGYGSGGSYWGGWSGWDGSGSDCAGTPENQYTSSNCGSNGGYGGGGGCGGWGYGGGGGNCGSGGDNNNGGTCGNGSSGGSCSQGQLGNSPEADTVTVTATTLGQGFSLGDAGNYAIIGFGASKFVAASSDPINGSVGLGTSCGSSTVQLNGDKITGSLVATGTKPSSTGGTVTGTITGNSSTLAGDISSLQALSTLLAGETGTSIALTSGATIQAANGTFDSLGDEVFNVTKWANNITINGDGTQDVVLNFASGVTPNLDNVTLTGGLTANEVLFNYTGSSTITGTSGDTFNGTVLAPNAVFNVSAGVTIDGHLYGGKSGQQFTFNGGATITAPADTSSTTTTTTVTASDSKEVEVLSNSSSITENGSTPTGALTTLYGAAKTIEFAYSPSDTVSLKQVVAGLATESGNNTSSLAFIEVSNNSNPFATNASIYFEGEVTTGEKIFADATINQLTNTPVPNGVLPSGANDIYMYVFGSQSAFQSSTAPVQTMAYNTGSSAMHLGDQIGSLTVDGYIGAKGGHLVS